MIYVKEDRAMAREINKLVMRTMAFTLLTIVGTAVLVFLLLSFVAPAAMARFTCDLGMYKQSAWYSSLQYADGAGDIENAEFAMNCCVLAEDDEGVAKYGAQFIGDKRFQEYSLSREREEAESGKAYLESYTQYVYGLIGVAYYRIGRSEEAVRLTLSINETEFAEYNAVNDLVTEAIIKSDKAFATSILTKLSARKETGAYEDTEYLDATIETLKKFTA